MDADTILLWLTRANSLPPLGVDLGARGDLYSIHDGIRFTSSTMIEVEGSGKYFLTSVSVDGRVMGPSGFDPVNGVDGEGRIIR